MALYGSIIDIKMRMLRIPELKRNTNNKNNMQLWKGKHLALTIALNKER